MGDVQIVLAQGAAPTALAVRFLTPDGSISTVPEVIPAGSSDPVFRTQFGGTYGIRINDTNCAGSYEIRDQLRTVVIVDIETTPCWIRVEGFQPLPY